MKELVEKRIELYELKDYPEKHNRRFRINYVEQGGVVRLDKIFQKKVYLHQYLENPRNTKIKLYVGDVIERDGV